MEIKFSKNVIIQRYRKSLTHAEWQKRRDAMSGQKDLDSRIRLGGSDVGVIMDLSDFKTAAAFYYELIGLKKASDEYNAHMHRGHVFEEPIQQKYWVYYDPHADTLAAFLENARLDRKQRRAIFIPMMARNKKYRQLFANCDFFIPAYGEFEKGNDGILEIKSQYRTALEKWLGGIPPSHIVQAQTYMTVTEKQWAEVFILADATIPNLFPLEYNKNIETNILKNVHDFCYRVNKVRKEMKKIIDPGQIWQLAHDYEPPIVERPAYIEFLKEMYRPENIRATIDGGKGLLNRVIEYADIRIKMAEMANKLISPEIVIRKEFMDRGADTISFPFTDDDGKRYPNITWKQKFNIPFKKFSTKTKE